MYSFTEVWSSSLNQNQGLTLVKEKETLLFCYSKPLKARGENMIVTYLKFE